MGFVDRPLEEDHKRHGKSTPVLGGLAMFIAWGATIGSGLFVSSVCKDILSNNVSFFLPGIQTVMLQLIVILIGAMLLTGLGLIDDRWSMDAFSKLAGQFCIAGAVACWGIRITLFWKFPLATWCITTCWILLIVNAVNFFDNMDGLAAGAKSAGQAARLHFCPRAWPKRAP